MSLRSRHERVSFTLLVTLTALSCVFEEPVAPEYGLEVEVLGPARQAESNDFGVRVTVEPRGGDQLRRGVDGGLLRAAQGEAQASACLILASPNVPLNVFVIPDDTEAVLWAELWTADDGGDGSTCPEGTVREQAI